MKQIFSQLADVEIKNKKAFENMLSRIEEYEPLESYPGEYLGYLRSYVDRIIFTDEEMKRDFQDK